jgi:hypothetical protein
MPLMTLQPKSTGNFERVDIALLPPLPFLTGGVNLMMVDGAERNRELVADLQAEPARLRVADVMRV